MVSPQLLKKKSFRTFILQCIKATAYRQTVLQGGSDTKSREAQCVLHICHWQRNPKQHEQNNANIEGPYPKPRRKQKQLSARQGEVFPLQSGKGYRAARNCTCYFAGADQCEQKRPESGLQSLGTGFRIWQYDCPVSPPLSPLTTPLSYVPGMPLERPQRGPALTEHCRRSINAPPAPLMGSAAPLHCCWCQFSTRLATADALDGTFATALGLGARV